MAHMISLKDADHRYVPDKVQAKGYIYLELTYNVRIRSVPETAKKIHDIQIQNTYIEEIQNCNCYTHKPLKMLHTCENVLPHLFICLSGTLKANQMTLCKAAWFPCMITQSQKHFCIYVSTLLMHNHKIFTLKIEARFVFSKNIYFLPQHLPLDSLKCDCSKQVFCSFLLTGKHVKGTVKVIAYIMQ